MRPETRVAMEMLFSAKWNLPQAARDAELNPPTLPDHDNTEIPEDPS